MGSPSSETLGSNEENPRVKLLCSFFGNIMPRPQDGKLRYVGGETRIVSLPREIGYEELMTKMRELYDGATLLKYQQPDEDLDALVSVVNDDDVTNMMEEYDKLGSGDGFTRLRVFLFSHPEHETSPHFVDSDERESEKRYVDALNSLNDESDFRTQQLIDSSVIHSIDDAHMNEQFYNQANLEVPISQFNLRHLRIPRMGLGQHQQSVAPRYNEVEAAWSPGYYSPRHHGNHDFRPLTEFASSPAARLRMPLGDVSDKIPEEYIRNQVNQQSQYDPQPQFTENLVWFPPGILHADTASFQGNLAQGSNAFEGNSICDHCQMSFPRNHANPDSQLEQSIEGNGAHQISNPSVECSPNVAPFLLNTDPKLHHDIYQNEQGGPQGIYNNIQSHEHGRILHHHLNPHADETRAHISVSGRLSDQYTVDGAGMNFPLGHTNLSENRRASPKEIFRDQVITTGPHIPNPLEEHGVRYGHSPYTYAGDNVYQVSHGHIPAHALWRHAQNPVHGAFPYQSSSLVQHANVMANPCFFRGSAEGSPRICTGVENQNTLVEPSFKGLNFNGSYVPVPGFAYGHHLNLNTGTIGQGNQHQFVQGHDQVPFQPDFINFATPEPVQYSNPSSSPTGDKSIILTVPGYSIHTNIDTTIGQKLNMEGKGSIEKEKLTETFEGAHMETVSTPRKYENGDKMPDVTCLESVNSDHLKQRDACVDVAKVHESALPAPENFKLSDQCLSSAPEQREVLEAEGKHASDVSLQVVATKKSALDEFDIANSNHESKLDSENDNLSITMIEPTKAEEEAIARGLQTIKNDDIEEIRELGSGTYGAVYFGKWKGSDVAIKRIKASCFAGKTSERERLIADFWKEALILSSLHHPNVVSFYGIVRDGPDGSLATVTEFMVNGSLKQFLKKKDRTIDRRKRLIIAMDTAFGMEYLHGKNIVHFDIKCENLLVNMRDPHRPVCKIGDLGLSKVKQKTLVSGGVRGTLPWMAPELLSGKSSMVTEKIDVYSFGIVMWELLTGEEPYGDMHCASIIGGIVNNSLRPQIPIWSDPEWRCLMESCWAAEPVNRPSFSEISQKLRTMAAAINVK